MIEKIPTYKIGKDGYTILSLTKFEEKEKYFKYYASRIAPFLTSYVRIYMIELINKYKNDVVYSHTVSLIIKNDENTFKNFEISDEIGKWKIEKEYNNLKIKKSRVYEMKYKYNNINF